MHICLECHKKYKVNPSERRPSTQQNRAGLRFLQTIAENFPEYVCTSCHRCLFKKSVKKFDISNYDMDNFLVQTCLSQKYRYVHKTSTDSGKESSTEIYNEFICKTCHASLRRQNPRMPAQAVANALQLPPIPPELQGLTDLERRLISLRIPFMKIISLITL